MSLEKDSDGFPKVDPTHFYTSAEAAALLLEDDSTLRAWRHREQGPRYYQRGKNSPVKYLGQWLIEFRKANIREPAV